MVKFIDISIIQISYKKQLLKISKRFVTETIVLDLLRKRINRASYLISCICVSGSTLHASFTGCSSFPHFIIKLLVLLHPVSLWGICQCVLNINSVFIRFIPLHFMFWIVSSWFFHDKDTFKHITQMSKRKKKRNQWNHFLFCTPAFRLVTGWWLNLLCAWIMTLKMTMTKKAPSMFFLNCIVSRSSFLPRITCR